MCVTEMGGARTRTRPGGQRVWLIAISLTDFDSVQSSRTTAFFLHPWDQEDVATGQNVQLLHTIPEFCPKALNFELLRC